MTASKLFALCVFPLALVACDRGEHKAANAPPPSPAETSQSAPAEIALVPLAPGGKAPPQRISAEAKQVENDPEQIAAGGQLFLAMNCAGCHSHGGGGMGPALMDKAWIYGSSIDNIAATIREGRPNGMPSFRGFLPDEQIFQIAAYVKSISVDANVPEAPPSTH